MRKQKEMTAQTVRKVNMKDWNLKMRMKTLNHLKMCEFCCLKILVNIFHLVLRGGGSA